MTTHIAVMPGLVLQTQVLSGANSHGGGSRQAPDKRSQKKDRVYAAPGLLKINRTVDMHNVPDGGFGPQATHPLAWSQGVQHG
jgi:hypothetical protein